MKGSGRTILTTSSIILLSIAVILVATYFLMPLFTRDTYVFNVKTSQVSSDQETPADTPTTTPPVEHIATPSQVKGIYMSACAVGSQSFRQDLFNLIQNSELNSIVIDLKDYSGMLSYTSSNPELAQYRSNRCYASDMKDFVTSLHEKGVYVIGRITTFQDPYYARLHPEVAIKSKTTGGIWTDKKGLAYIDPSSHDAWDHVVAIARDAHDNFGFDEINFDYIRYPSDGNVSDMRIPPEEGGSKSAVLESFFAYLDGKMREGSIVHSADLFGMTTTNADDLGIGQVLEKTMPYFDYIDPMVYPSHYPPGFNGWQNPNAHPYDLIHYVMNSAVKRTIATTTTIKTMNSEPIASTTPQLYTKEAYDAHKMRPWLQDFNLGEPAYTSDQVRAQIQATYDVGLNSWLVWNAANHYTAGAFGNKQMANNSDVNNSQQ